MAGRKTTEQFIADATAVHGNKYDYSKVEYINTKTKVVIICKDHGEFQQTPTGHLSGRGCYSCGRVVYSRAGNAAMKRMKTKTTAKFIKDSRVVHSNKYNYSTSKYINGNIKIEILCPDHGVFLQTPYTHLKGHGCPQCAQEVILSKAKELAKILTKTTKQFIDEARGIHGNRYDYSGVNYINAKSKLIIGCPDHGWYEQFPNGHLRGHGCPQCAGVGPSKGEVELGDWLESLGINIIRNDRSLITPKEIDIVIPGHKLAIEYNGNIFHSEKFNTPKRYHLDKLEVCAKEGYRLIIVRDDEWQSDAIRPIVKSIITNAIGKTPNKIMARKCEVRETPIREFQLFADENHMQGRAPASVRLGLYYKGKLVTCAAWREAVDGNELVRFVTKIDHIVMGGFSKLLKAYNKPFKTYCERRLFNGSGYRAAGLIRSGKPSCPDLWFVSGNRVANRRSFQKRNQEKMYEERGMDFNWGDTEAVSAARLGWHRMFMCGTIKYTYSPT